MKSAANFDRAIKLLGIFAVILSAISLIICYLDPATSYELSIYVSTPLLTWFLIPISTFIALSIIIISFFVKGKSKIWILGLFVLFFNRLIIQWLPFIRGYFSMSGDHISHISFILDIVKTGYIGDNNFYPFTHIVLSELSLISNIQIIPMGNFSTALISAISVLSIYVLAKFILKNNVAEIVTFASATVIFFSGYDLLLMPNGWSIFLIPITLFAFLKSQSTNKTSWSILLLLFLWAIPFYHPLTALMIIFILLIIGFTNYFINALKVGRLKILVVKNYLPYNQILIVSTIFLVWVLSFQLFSVNVSSLYEAITSGSPNAFLNRLDSGTSKLNFSTFDLIMYIIKSVGHDIIYLSLYLLAFIYYFKNNCYNNKVHIQVAIIFMITAIFLILYAGYIGNLIPGLHVIGGGRILAYSMLLTPIIIGWVFNQLSNKKQLNKITAFSFIILIFIASSLSLFSFIPSPYIEGPSIQVAQSDVSTASWVFNYSDDSKIVSSILTPVSRYASLLFGATEGKIVASETNRIPDHFGYDNNQSLGTTLNGGGIIVINKIDRIVYTTAWVSVGRFTQDDFHQLSCDQSVDKLYTNHYGDIWMVSL